MKGRIKRSDLDHLLRLVQSGLPRGADGRHEHDNDRHHESGFGAPGILAPDHELWNANHAYWVDRLRHDTNCTWTDAQYSDAAAIINAAEYQHVVFSDIASALTRALSGGAHGEAGPGEPTQGRFAGAGSLAAPSRFEETFDLVDATTGQAHRVQLAAVLEDVRRLDAAGDGELVVAGASSGASAGAGRTDIALWSKQVNLGELTGGRARNGGPVPFNEVREDLFAQSGLMMLLPYADWEDFRDRNHLSEALIADLKAAYPDGFAAVDLWVGGLAERPAVGALGPTLAATLSAEISEMKMAGAQSHLDLLAGTHLASEISAQSWSDIVARNMVALQFAKFAPGESEQVPRTGHSTIIGTDGDDVLIGTDGNDLLLGGSGDDRLDGGAGADIMIGGSGNDTYVVDNILDQVIEQADGGTDTIETVLKAFILEDAAPAPAANAKAGESTSVSIESTPVSVESTPDAVDPPPAQSSASEDEDLPDIDFGEAGRAENVENLTFIGRGDFMGRGNSADNVLIGGSEDDMLWGGAGDDVLIGNDGDDALFGGSGNDVLFGGPGDDWFDGGTGDDVLYLAGDTGTSDGGAVDYGRDTIVLRPGFGNDVVIGFDSSSSSGRDRIDVSAYATLSADSIGTEIQITASGSHTVITINGDSVTLLDVNASTIGKDDFIFS